MADTSLGDAFEDDSKDVVHDNQWDTLKVARHNDGYREGVSDSKESAIQSGFNRGFDKGFACSQQAAKLRGFLWAIFGTLKNNKTDIDDIVKTQATEQLHGIIKSLLSIEQETIKEIQNSCNIHNKSGIDDIWKSPLSVDDVIHLTDEKMNLVKLKQQNDLEEIKKLSVDILTRLRLDDSIINKLKE